MRLLADIHSPWNHRTRRFIEAPVFRDLELLDTTDRPAADYWRLEVTQGENRWVVENDQPVLDTITFWDQVKIGYWANVAAMSMNRRTGWCITRKALGVPASMVTYGGIGVIARAPDWQDHVEEPMDYLASVRRNLDWFDSMENNPNAFYREPGMPAWWWHAHEGMDPANHKFADGTFPCIASIGIRAYLLASQCFPEKAQAYRQIATAIGDWLLKNRTPMTGKLPGMPYTSVQQGKFDYLVEGKAVSITRGGLPGLQLLLLHEMTGDKRYLDYALHIAGVLRQWVREDGSMPFRLMPDTGEVVQDRTCSHMLVGLFMDALPNGQGKDVADRIVQWALENPMKDFNWEAGFEDVNLRDKYSNLSSMDALWAVRLFVRRGLLQPALKLVRWVEDQFVNFGDEPSLLVKTYYPTVREQYHCDWPMEAHASNYAETCFVLHEATGDQTWRNKAVATLNAIIKSQRMDGAYSTWGKDRETGLGGFGSGWNWFNCNHGAAAQLLTYVLRSQGKRVTSY